MYRAALLALVLVLGLAAVSCQECETTDVMDPSVQISSNDSVDGQETAGTPLPPEWETVLCRWRCATDNFNGTVARVCKDSCGKQLSPYLP